MYWNVFCCSQIKDKPKVLQSTIVEKNDKSQVKQIHGINWSLQFVTCKVVKDSLVDIFQIKLIKIKVSFAGISVIMNFANCKNTKKFQVDKCKKAIYWSVIYCLQIKDKLKV